MSADRVRGENAGNVTKRDDRDEDADLLLERDRRRPARKSVSTIQPRGFDEYRRCSV